MAWFCVVGQTAQEILKNHTKHRKQTINVLNWECLGSKNSETEPFHTISAQMCIAPPAIYRRGKFTVAQTRNGCWGGTGRKQQMSEVSSVCGKGFNMKHRNEASRQRNVWRHRNEESLIRRPQKLEKYCGQANSRIQWRCPWRTSCTLLLPGGGRVRRLTLCRLLHN